MTRTRALDRLAGRAAHGEDVVSVEGDRRHPVRSRALDEALARRNRREPRADPVVVVLAHEHDGELPRSCEVRRLVEGALVRSTVPEERRHDLIGPAHLRRGVLRSNRDRQIRRDDPVRAEHSNARVGDVE